LVATTLREAFRRALSEGEKAGFDRLEVAAGPREPRDTILTVDARSCGDFMASASTR